MKTTVLGTLFNHVSSALGTVRTAAEIVLNVNYFLVKNIVTVFFWIYQSIAFIFVQLLAVLDTAFHDFVSFLGELFVYLNQCVQGCGNLLTSLGNGVQNFAFSVTKSVIIVRTAIVQFITKVFDPIWLIFEAVSSIVALIFRSVIFVLELIPYSIGVVIWSIYSAVESLAIFIVSLILNIANGICSSIQQFYLFCEYSLLSISGEAYIGLLIFVVLLATVIKSRRYLYSRRHIPFRYLARLRNRIQRYVNYAVLLAFLRRIKNLYRLCIQYFNNLIRSQRTRRNIPSTSNAGALQRQNLAVAAPSSRQRVTKKRSSKCKPSRESGESSDGGLAQELEKERDKLLCIICQDNPKTIMLLPCAHLCMCHDCRSAFLSTYRVCPICRRPILDTLRVYV